ncbi:Cytoplasmic tRNA 2-thiolation protein 2 [Pseudocercospora fuligena]|uniref:Cytoplasmic tRNA 2-thiolation protein 2 n=1 Tax=Pseudocercospora fuligena TaxID=685502 RepID=A0A8H6RFN6_9PEZI|nr:Cytoplasmic tRNA 2-thiolation protein 2 [Pseudocercospora fuligena]
MPARRLPETPIDDSLCRRCQLIEPAINVRTEPLCKDCFSKYVQTKVVKRMESFRVRNAGPGQHRKLLLPLSFDACSLALLHILSQHQRGQAEKTGRTGYKLYVLHIDNGSPVNTDDGSSLEKVKSRYPEHEYQSMPLSRLFSLDDMSGLFPEKATSDQGDEVDDNERLSAMLAASNKSATTRQDLSQILTRRLAVRQAKNSGCEAIILSDSTTKLAERILAETAKGRGLSLPWVVADGESPQGLPFYFPLRELLAKEAHAYLSFLVPAMDADMIRSDTRAPVSTKNTTIDDLMQQYFQTVEQEYPSIVANVVRTTNKLKAPSISLIEQLCELCSMPLEGQAPAKSRLCYGCIRTLPAAGD